MKTVNEEDYNSWKANNSDPYGACGFRYLEAWADLMEAEMAKGKALSEVAEKTSYAADTEGITGPMYGCAVAVLSKCWVHGEELRKWHNIKTQIHNEGETANENGGVLNPALLNIG
jgi:hypothetical protein